MIYAGKQIGNSELHEARFYITKYWPMACKMSHLGRAPLKGAFPLKMILACNLKRNPDNL
jgi:hypothetical protein